MNRKIKKILYRFMAAAVIIAAVVGMLGLENLNVYAEEATFTSSFEITINSDGSYTLKITETIKNAKRCQTHFDNGMTEDGADYYLLDSYKDITPTTTPEWNFSKVVSIRWTESENRTEGTSKSKTYTLSNKEAESAIKFSSATTPKVSSSTTSVTFTGAEYITHYAWLINAWCGYSLADVLTDIEEFNGGEAYKTAIQDNNTGYYKIGTSGSWTKYSSTTYTKSLYGIAAGTKIYFKTKSTTGIESKEASYTVLGYELNINPNGGTWNGSTSTQTLDKIGYGCTKSISTIATPTREGYTFAGWTIESGSGSSISNGTFTMGTEAATLKANWTANTYTLTVDPQGGTWTYNGNDYTSAHDISIKCNSAIYIANPTREGYTFDGWTITKGTGTLSTLTSSLSHFTMKAGDATITANWTANTYTLTIDPNQGSMYNGSSKTTSSFTTSFLYGRLTYMGNTFNNGRFYPSNTPTRTGYTFTGWTLRNSSTGQVLSSSSDAVLHFVLLYDKIKMSKEGYNEI